MVTAPNRDPSDIPFVTFNKTGLNKWRVVSCHDVVSVTESFKGYKSPDVNAHH